MKRVATVSAYVLLVGGGVLSVTSHHLIGPAVVAAGLCLGLIFERR